MNKEIKRYLKDIKKLLPVYSKREKKLVIMIKTSVLEIYGEDNTVSYNLICREFGNPEEIVISYLAETDDDELYKYMRYLKTIRITAVCVVIIVAAVAVSRSVFNI